MSIRVINVAGARPNFPKIAPIMSAMRADKEFDPLLVHTGQHYDAAMSDVFFEDLGIPKPDVSLGIGSGSHAVQTAGVMTAFEPILGQYKPDMVLVVGDVNSTLACTLVATKMHIPVAHVEAGLRSGDRRMPEEINRLATDALADLLLTPSADADANLLLEGAAPERIQLVGNVMIDTLLRSLEKAKRSDILEQTRQTPGTYGVLTLHRPSNVDDPETLSRLVHAVAEIQYPMVFPVHPRTADRLKSTGLDATLRDAGCSLVEPLGYLDFLQLMAHAKMVLTDSGGLQEETTALGIPCLTLRESTERPVTVDEGTNTVVGTDGRRIVDEARRILQGHGKHGRVPRYWDGRTADRILVAIRAFFERRSGNH